MGADQRLFDAQKAVFPNLIAAPWISLQPRDTLASYARRMAAALDPGGPCFVGGCSFGGMVAQEMTWHLDARACFLISSVRGPDEFPLRVRVLRPLAWLLPGFCAGVPGWLAGGDPCGSGQPDAARHAVCLSPVRRFQRPARSLGGPGRAGMAADFRRAPLSDLSNPRRSRPGSPLPPHPARRGRPRCRASAPPDSCRRGKRVSTLANGVDRREELAGSFTAKHYPG